MAREEKNGQYNGIYIRRFDATLPESGLLERHPSLTLNPNPSRVGEGGELAVSANDIIENGVSVTDALVDRPIVLDLKDINNPSIARILEMIETVKQDMQSDLAIGSLLQKEGDFLLADRLIWEKVLAARTAERLAKDPVLGTYRLEGSPTDTNFDDMSQMTLENEYVCRHMGTIQAVIQQKVENELLPNFSKTPTDYHVLGGMVAWKGTVEGGHVAFLSSKTGSMTEATAGPGRQNYYPVSTPGEDSFRSVIEGREPFISADRNEKGKPLYVFGGDVQNPALALSAGGSRAERYQRFVDSFSPSEVESPDQQPHTPPYRHVLDHKSSSKHNSHRQRVPTTELKRVSSSRHGPSLSV